MSGALPADQKHIVVMEVPGPLTAEQYEAFRAALQGLADRYNVQVSVHARGKKVGAGGAPPAK